MTWPDAPLVARGSLYAALAVMGTCIALLTLLLLVAMRRAAVLRMRRAASDAAAPTLQSALVAFLAGGTDDSIFRRYAASQPDDLTDAIWLLLTTVAGSARDRLCALALDLGLVRQWCADARSPHLLCRRAAFARLAYACVHEPCRQMAGPLMREALGDSDEEVRLSACQGLVLAGGEDEVERLFALAIRPNLLTRIVLTEDLRRHALALAAPARRALSADDSLRVRATLEVLVAWERAIPLEDLRDLLEHREREIRVLALRLAGFVSVDYESRMALVRTLHDADPGIRTLAIFALGRQKRVDAIPELALCLRRESLELARHAAAALAALAPQGWKTLEELSASPDPVTALAAGEALARARAEA